MLHIFFIIQTHIHIPTHVYEFMANICFHFEKKDLATILKIGVLNILAKGRSSSFESNLVFIKSFLYLIDKGRFDF